MLETFETLLLRNRKASKGAPKIRHLEEEETADLIIQCLETRKSLYIVLDGINECEDPRSILQWLAKIMTSSVDCVVRLFISSINEKDIGKFSKISLFGSLAVLRITGAGVNGKSLGREVDYPPPFLIFHEVHIREIQLCLIGNHPKHSFFNK